MQGPVILYGVAMQQAAASGDISRMKEVCRQAEDYLEKVGDISAALQVLKVEIAKLEKK
ncbi:DUF1843 domain-containing protein [Methylogaea oryzae]|uniref:DUF1843 domain-containing protein n=1 Tax=Methylogaea oryzae TaxID=1295382 RepID=UPI0009E89159|nr:DUF1843 domain-containing protein [Methylogaea oryzae]